MVENQVEMDGNACPAGAVCGFGSLKEGAEGKSSVWGEDKARLEGKCIRVLGLFVVLRLWELMFFTVR